MIMKQLMKIFLNICWYFWKSRVKFLFFLFLLIVYSLLPSKKEDDIFQYDYYNAEYTKWLIINIPLKRSINEYHFEEVTQYNIIVVANHNYNNLPRNIFYFLGPNDESHFTFSFLNYISGYHARKMIAYMLAFQYGAKHILEYEYSGIKIKISFIPNLKSISHLLYKTNATMINTLPIFGQNQISMRIPSQNLLQNLSFKSIFDICPISQPLIEDGIVLEAENELPVNKIKKSNRLVFDKIAPRLVFPFNSFVAHHSNNVLFSKEAFFLLFLPQSVSIFVADIFRKLWQQKLLMLTGNYMSFGPPISIENFQEDAIKNIYLSDDLLKINTFLKYLREWTCSLKEGKLDDYLSCMHLLANDLVESNHWAPNDIFLMNSWLQDLQNNGYQLPIFDLISNSNLKGKECSGKVVYYPSFGEDGIINSENYSIKKKNQMCRKIKETVSTDLSKQKFAKIILIVGVFKEISSVVSLYTMMYKKYFEAIYFCTNVDIEFISIWKASYIYLKKESVGVIACLSAVGSLQIENVHFIYVPDNVLLLRRNLVAKQHHLVWMSSSMDVITSSSLKNCANGSIRCTHISIQTLEKIYTLISNSSYSPFITNDERIRVLTCLNKMKNDPIWYSSTFQVWFNDIVFKVPSHLLPYLSRLRGLFNGNIETFKIYKMDTGLKENVFDGLHLYEILIIFFLENEEMTVEYLSYSDDMNATSVDYLFPIHDLQFKNKQLLQVLCDK